MSERKLPATNRHDALKRLKDGRNAEVALELYHEGKLKFSDLTDKEKQMYERQVWLMAKIKANGKVRFDRDNILEAHCNRFDISIATANRDLKFVNDQKRKLMDAELEFHKFYLLQKAYDAIEIAESAGQDIEYYGDDEDEEDTEPRTRAAKGSDKVAAASGMTKGILAALKALGIDGKENGKGIVDASKIEQHINILIADPRTSIILTELVKNNISVLKHNMSLNEILRLEQEQLKNNPKIEPSEYEDIGSDATEDGD
jgi:hypothetical protein